MLRNDSVSVTSASNKSVEEVIIVSWSQRSFSDTEINSDKQLVQRYRGYLAYIILEDDDIIPASDSENKPQGDVRVRYNIIKAVTRFNCCHQAATGIINYYHNESTVKTSLVLPGPNNVKLKTCWK